MIGREIFTLDDTTYKMKSFTLNSITTIATKDGITTYLGEGSPNWKSHELQKCFTTREDLLNYIRS